MSILWLAPPNSKALYISRLGYSPGHRRRLAEHLDLFKVPCPEQSSHVVGSQRAQALEAWNFARPPPCPNSRRSELWTLGGVLYWSRFACVLSRVSVQLPVKMHCGSDAIGGVW